MHARNLVTKKKKGDTWTKPHEMRIKVTWGVLVLDGEGGAVGGVIERW